MITKEFAELIIKSIKGNEKITIVQAESLLAGSIEFIRREKWREAAVCNNEGIRLLENILVQVRENKIFLNNKISEIR